MINKLLCIVGPTGTGKTALGLKIAEKFGGEIVSCDSRQLYRGMDIVTGKDIPENSKYQIPNSKQKIFIKTQIIKKSKNRIKPVSFKGIPVWGVDLVEPNEEFTAAHWVQYANVVIKDIWNRHRLPVIVGGTGFWLRSLLGKIETLGVSPDDKLRRRLAHKKPEELFIILTKLDCKRAEKMNRSDRMNPRRLIRAIEIARQVKSYKFKVRSYNDKLQIIPKNILIIGLTGDIALLEKRIQKRVTDRLKEGAMDETKRLLKKGYQSGLPSMTACGYRVLTEATKNNWPEKELALRWLQSERGYLKRQQTWFHKEKGIRWFNIGRNGWEEEVVQKVKNWYDN